MEGEWREIRLGDLVARGELVISDGYRVRNEELGSEGIPFVRGGDIGDGWINTDTIDHIRPELAERVQAKLAYVGDVAFITKGTVGRAGRLRPGQPAVVFAPQVAYWRVLSTETLDSRFLFYLIRSHEFQSALNGVKTHGSMVADYVSISQQHDFQFRFPDIGSQRAIAHILGTLDDKIELNRRMNKTLEAIARALFTSWFVNFDPVCAKADGRDPGLPKQIADLFPDRLVASELGEIPEGWAVEVVGDHVKSVKGKSYTSEELQDSATALVTLKSFARGGGYRHDGLKAYSGAFKPEQVVRPGELVIACTDVTQAAEVIGKPALVRSSDEFTTLVASLDVLVVRPRDVAVSVPFLYCLFRTDLFSDHAYAHSSGTTVLHLAKEAVPSYRFVLPAEKIAKSFASIADPIFKRIDDNDREARTLAVLRDALLPKFITGQLRVNDVERLFRRHT